MLHLPSFLRRLLPALALSAAAIAPGVASAAYPEQPIKVVIAFPPGGGTDVIARLTVQYMQKYLNNANFVALNRPGAGGGIGFAELMNAAPDGYTIGFINTPNVLTIPIERKSNFHWEKFDLLGNVVDDPGNFSVHADSPIKSLAELAAYAKANPPGTVTYGTTGVGSDDHLAALAFERAAGVKMTHVPFKGAAEVHNAIAGKQIMVAAMNIGEALQYQKGGTPLRHLGQMSEKRSTLAPNVPTFKEQGFNVVMASLRGMAAPKGLPPAVREQLVAALQKAVADPEYQTKAAGYFAPLRYLAPAAYATELKDGEAEFKKLWQTTPWTDK
jgi:tripartite-type tricarboxylate transporter receptor subunit TctC